MQTGGLAAAQLGFEGPRDTLKPASSFSVVLVGQFAQDEPAGWTHGDVPQLTVNVAWPSCVTVLTCHWNTAEWVVTESGLDEGTLWGMATAVNPQALSCSVAIATLECAAVGIGNDTFFYDTADAALPYPTALTVGESRRLRDILGDPHNRDDGVDELAVGVGDTPGYTLSLRPAQQSVPLMREAAQVDLALGHSGDPAPFEHVRACLSFDEDVAALDNMAGLCASLPPFVTNAVIHCPARTAVPAGIAGVTVLTDAPAGMLVIDLRCTPTNFAGRLARIALMPQALATDSPLEFDLRDGAWFTTAGRFGVDLLGSADDPFDGTENSSLTVGSVDGLRLALEPVDAVATVGSASQARVVVRKSAAGVVAFDRLRLEMWFDRALLECAATSFSPNAAVVGAGALVSVSLLSNQFVPDPGQPVVYPWTNTAVALDISWGSAFTSAANEVVVGTLWFTPRAAGLAGFLPGAPAISLGSCRLDDEAASGADWPATFAVVSGNSDAKRVFVSLGLPTNQPVAVMPGSTFRLVPTMVGSALTDASYALVWAYDSNLVRLLTASANVTNMVAYVAGETSAVLCVQGVATTRSTTELDLVEFIALQPGMVTFLPLTPALSPSLFSSVMEGGKDVLGADSVVGDGVSGCSLTIGWPEGVTLQFAPDEPCYLGVATPVALLLANPSTCWWDSVSADVLIGQRAFHTSAGAWTLSALDSAELNLVTTIVQAGGPATTSVWSRARIAAHAPARADAACLASLELTPLDADVAADLDWIASNTYVRYGSLEIDSGGPLSDPAAWAVYPNGVRVWLDDPGTPPVLASNYVLTIRVDNPHGVRASRVSCCWYYDRDQLEVASIRLLPGWTTNGGGCLIIEPFAGAASFVCADVLAAAEPATTDFAVAELTIVPKLNQVLEFSPAGLLRDDGSVIPLAVENEEGVNVMALADQKPEDVCPVWRRGVTWVEVPQLLLDDIELFPFETTVIPLDEFVQNYVTGMLYRWWIEGDQSHVSFSFNLQTRMMTVSSLDEWDGTALFALSCRAEGGTRTGWTTVRVVVGTGAPGLGLSMPRSEFRWIIAHDFREALFNVANATTAVAVSAWIRYPDLVWRAVEVEDVVSGTTGAVLDIRSQGRVVWHESGAGPGWYLGRLDLRYAAEPTNAVAAQEFFPVELINPGIDSDGDVFYMVYKSPWGVQAFSTPVIRLDRGCNNDTLKLVVYRGAVGDGLVALDTIASVAGFRKIELDGSVNVIEAGGTLGELKIRGGTLGELTVRNGGIGSVTIRNVWVPADGSFAAEAGILRGIHAGQAIGQIAVVGGSIGAPDMPAIIEAQNGNIKSVTATVMKKNDPALGLVIAGDEGANIYADIRAPHGSIGSVAAYGGSVGTVYDNPPCTISAGGSIGSVRARALACGGAPYGGSVCADIEAGASIGTIEARGGDITRTEIFDPEDLANPELLGVSISASVISSVKASSLVVWDRMSRTPYGGSIRAAITAWKSVGTLSVQGGNACVQLNVTGSGGSIGSISTRALSYLEYPGDPYPIWRGGSVVNSIVAVTAGGAFKSANPVDYGGPLKALRADVAVRNSWLGYRGPADWSKFGYNSFKCRQYPGSEIWEAKGSFLHIRTF